MERMTELPLSELRKRRGERREMGGGGGRCNETKMCSEQTRLSRHVIEGHQGSKQPVCIYSRKCVNKSMLLNVTRRDEC